MTTWSAAVVLAAVLAADSGGAQHERNEIRLSQLGFQPAGPKRAIVASAATEPLGWMLTDADGKQVASGATTVFGHNAASAEHLHVIDFSSFSEPGASYRLSVGAVRSRTFDIDTQLYSSLQQDAFAYFYHNRSGIPIEAAFVTERWARPAGHVLERVSCFSGTDKHGRQWPGCSYTLDATGGWYDAGDHGKYVVNAGISVWTLLNYYERSLHLHGTEPAAFADGRAAIPERDNGVSDLLDEVRWQLRFMLGMQAPQGARLKMPAAGQDATGFVELDVSGMVHHKLHSEEWTAFPSAPHEDARARYAYPPSTAATLNLAANAAQCARIWRGIDRRFSTQCRAAAERAYAAAKRHPDLLAVDAFSGGGAYGDKDVTDELYWAAAELFITTGKQEYAQDMRASAHFLSPAPTESAPRQMAWPRTAMLGTISLATVPSKLANDELDAARSHLVAAADHYVAEEAREGYGIPYAGQPYEWGSSSALLNRAIVLALAYDFTGEARYRNRVVDVLDYLLGRNPLDQSFISGYGARAMLHPHHRYWAHSKDPRFPPPPPGALSGGPNASNMSDPVAVKMRGTCAPQLCWADHADAYALNEVAINWNAPLVWVAAFINEGTPVR